MAKNLGEPATLRQRKVNSALREKIAQIILEEHFSGLSGLVTIHAVECTADLREAKVWFSSINQDPEVALKILNRNLFTIQGRLYKGATMRIVPKIIFYIDRSGEFASHIGQVFSKMNDE